MDFGVMVSILAVGAPLLAVFLAAVAFVVRWGVRPMIGEVKTGLAEVNARLDAGLAELNAKIAEVNARLDAGLAELNAKIAEVNARLDVGLAGVDAKIAEVNTKIAEVNARLDVGLAGVEAKIAGVEAKIVEVNARLGSLESRFDGLERRFDRLEMRVDGLYGAGGAVTERQTGDSAWRREADRRPSARIEGRQTEAAAPTPAAERAGAAV